MPKVIPLIYDMRKVELEVGVCFHGQCPFFLTCLCCSLLTDKYRSFWASISASSSELRTYQNLTNLFWFIFPPAEFHWSSNTCPVHLWLHPIFLFLSSYHPWLLYTKQKQELLVLEAITGMKWIQNIWLSACWNLRHQASTCCSSLGIFLELQGSLSFRSTFFGCLAGHSVYSIRFNFPALITTQRC